MTPPTTKEHARPAVQKTSSAAPTRQRGKETAWRRLAGSLAKAQELLLQIRAVAEAAIDGAPQAKRELQALAACVGPLINTDPEEGTSLAEIFGLLKQLDAADIPAPDARPAKYATGDKVRVSAQAPKIYTQDGLFSAADLRDLTVAKVALNGRTYLCRTAGGLTVKVIQKHLERAE